jgi:cell wall-associated NlpC family hydrolase
MADGQGPTGAASQLGQAPQTDPSSDAGGGSDLAAETSGPGLAGACTAGLEAALPLTPGSRARLLPDGQAAAPADAPAVVKAMIAAGNQIVGKPYVYGGGHGLPLSQIAPSYDCSSSVDHILYGGGLLPVASTPTSGELESFGAPGPGRWVTLYASAVHVFMYVAGLRWDTWNAGGLGDGSSGIGWHPLVRNADGFVARHPEGP